jgi:uncharacterized phage-like protein YoqJ
MKLAVTGHRPNKLGGYRVPNPVSDAVGQLLLQYFERERPEEVITGMALGFDQWVAWVCVEMNIPFAAYIPCDSFTSRWSQMQVQEYQDLLPRARRVVFVSPGEGYSPALMQVRSVRMVNDADKVLALWNGTAGGTANCIRYARSVPKPIDYLPLPVELWDHAREWEVANRRPRAATTPVIGRPSRIRRRRPPIVSQVARLAEEVRIEEIDVPARPLRAGWRVAETTEPRPSLMDPFPLPEVPEDPQRRARAMADILRNQLADDVLQALVDAVRPTPDPPKPQTDNTEDKFSPRRKLDFDE